MSISIEEMKKAVTKACKEAAQKTYKKCLQAQYNEICPKGGFHDYELLNTRNGCINCGANKK